jgi:hypothetical protein
MKRMVGLMVRCHLRSPQSQQYWKQITEFGTKLLKIERNWCVQTFFRVDVQQQRVRRGVVAEEQSVDTPVDEAMRAKLRE